MYYAVADRIFWIYFLIILLFTIIGSYLIFSSVIAQPIFIFAIWIAINVGLLVMVYSAVNIECYNGRWIPNKHHLFTRINLLFVILLLAGLLVVDRLEQSSTIAAMAGIVALMGGLIFTRILANDGVSLAAAVIYLVAWLILILYVII